MIKRFFIQMLFVSFLFNCCRQPKTYTSDVIVYGGTGAGIICAIQLAMDGKEVCIVEPTGHVGGMSVEGLGGTDINNHKEFQNDQAVGGLALEFYQKVAKYYGISDFEEQRKHAEIWRFEPHVAEEIFNDWLREYHIPLHLNERLILDTMAVRKDKNRLIGFQTESGKIFQAALFVDATYEGDLLYYAGVSTTFGRESNLQYGESKNGIRCTNNYRQFGVKVSPYVIPDDSTSGVIHTIQNERLTPEECGSGDHRIQAFCFRACLTKDSANRVPFKKPENYHREWYEIYTRYLKAGGTLYTPGASIPNGKTDLGAWHDLSHNLYGMNHDWPNGDYKTRERIYNYHLDFTRGLFWFLANDTAVPMDLRQEWKNWGTTRDEFIDNEGWPRMIYVRDGRRMVSDYVMTEHHTRNDTSIEITDPVGVAHWPPDVHHVRRIVMNGAVYNEGFVFGGSDWKPFSIAYRSLVPLKQECPNLLTPTCPSSSHIAYGAIRLEWTFMVLGQSVGSAASLILDQGIAVQDLDYKKLEKKLIDDRQVLKPL